MCRTRASSRARRGFTLVELLVVIGIIAVLISILLPTVNSARRSADRVKCMSNMRQMGQAYQFYSNENKGWFPAAKWNFNNAAGTAREKRWHDFIGKYLVGSIGTKIGTTITTGELNPGGSQASSVERQMWSPEIMNGNNALWGCPSWQRATVVGTTISFESTFHNGYAQSPYFCSPNDLTPAGGIDVNRRTFYSTSVTPNVGTWARQNQYTKPSERGLIVESVHGNLAIPATAWTYQPEGTTAWWPKPDGGSFSIDFDRHGKLRSGNKPNDPSLNMLYVDGHVGHVSAREAWRGIRFK